MRISMPRGDIRWQRFILKTPEGNTSELDFTNIYFTVKKNSRDREYLFQKSYKRGEIYKLNPGDYQFKIDAKDTETLAVGDYKFDIQVSYKNLLKESYVGDFVLKEEVTYYFNEEGIEPDSDFEFPEPSEDHTVIITIPDYHILELATPIAAGETDSDYNNLINQPIINGVVIRGDLSLQELGIQPAGGSYTLPVASSDTLGGIKIGQGLQIDQNGVVTSSGMSLSGHLEIKSSAGVWGYPGTYVHLIINNKDSVFINVSDLNNRIEEGDGNGQIKANGTNVNVHGLGSAAFVNTNSFDVNGAAGSVLGTSSDVSSSATVYGVKKYASDIYDAIQSLSNAEIDAAFN